MMDSSPTPPKLAQSEVPSSKWSLVTNLCQRTTSNVLTQNALASSRIENNTFVWLALISYEDPPHSNLFFSVMGSL
jgi:hypothetical protein